MSCQAIAEVSSGWLCTGKNWECLVLENALEKVRVTLETLKDKMPG